MMDESQKKVVIELRDVKRDFLVGEEIVHALRGVSFKIYEGEFVTIMGKSGSGSHCNEYGISKMLCLALIDCVYKRIVKRNCEQHYPA